MREPDDIRNSIVEFWRAVLIALAAFAAMVVYIFSSSALEWKHEQERLELLAKQKIAAKVGKVSVYSFINVWEMADVGIRGTTQYRRDSKLDVGVEYETGRLRYYNVNDESGNIRGFDHVLDVATDDPTYIEPLITVQYAKFIHVKYSIDGGDGWLIGGPTRKGLKTGEWLYTLPEVTESNTSRDAWGEKSLTVRVPVNGLNGLAVNIDSAEVSTPMRGYNYITTERFGDKFLNVPDELADRERKIYTSHLIIEGWRTDPREWKTNANSKALEPTPEVTVLVRIKHYGEWDITAEEYESVRYRVYGLADVNNREFSPYTTVTYVGMSGSAAAAE